MLAPDPGPTAAWYRLGPKEAWGMLFLAIAVLLMVLRRRDAWVFLFVTLAAYSKESFLITVPGLFAFRWWLDARETKSWPALRALWRVAIAYAVLYAIGVAGVVVALKSAGEHSYGAKNLAMTPGIVASVFLRDATFAPMLCAWFLPFLLSLFVRRPTLLAVVVFAVWVAPQYALHAPRGGFWDHYWLPCVAAFAMVNAYGVSVLQRSRWLYRFAIAVFALWTINALRIDIPAVRNHVEKARVQQEAVRTATQYARADGDLLIVHDPEIQSETAPAFASFVAAAGGQFRHARLTDSRAASIDTSGAAVVVYLDDTRDAVPVSAEWRTIDVKGKRVYVSLRKRGLDAIPFRLRVDVKR
jgi:hypothetical protein